MPAVSVIIPAWNRAATIAGAVDSALRQTVAPCEVLVVDDGSTDGTAEIAGQRSAAVRVVRRPRGGVSAARNRGLAEARGDLVLFLDSDDRLAPDALERGLAALDETLTMLVFSARRLDADDRDLGVWTKPGRSRFYSVAGLLGDERRFAQVFGLARPGALRAAGGFDETLRRSEDWELLLRLVALGHRIAVLREPVYLYRDAGGSLSSARAENARARLAALHRFERRFPQVASRHRLAVRRVRASYHHAAARPALAEPSAGRTARLRALAHMRRAAAAWPLRPRILRDLLRARAALR
ncbi:MAG: hypothetical protein Kow0062_14970 [Acidobacteriota bacterium]